MLAMVINGNFSCDYRGMPFNLQKWLIIIFSLNFWYIIQQRCIEITWSYQLDDVIAINTIFLVLILKELFGNWKWQLQINYEGLRILKYQNI